jgi:hypothetical protein
MKSGDLARLIDVMGTDRGLCIFISKRRLTPDDRVPEDSSHWHFEVIHENQIKLLNTFNWTLIAPQ